MRLQKISLFIFLLLILTSYAYAETYFSITLDYDKGDLSVNNVKLVESEEIIDLSSGIGEYNLILKSFKGETLFQTRFDIDTTIYSAPLEEWFDDEGNQIVIPDVEEDMQLEKTAKVVFAPYFTNVKNGLVEKNKDNILFVDLEEYSICNENSICENVEDYLTCPSDCNKLSWWQRFLIWLKDLF